MILLYKFYLKKKDFNFFLQSFLQVILAKAYLHGFKFDHIVQDIKDGESTGLVDGESAEVMINTYKLNENGTIQLTDVKMNFKL